MSIFAPGQHDACPRGCGDLEDQCACPSAQARQAAQQAYEDEVQAALYDEDADFRGGCSGSWRGRPCPDEAVARGYCEAHLDKYSE